MSRAIALLWNAVGNKRRLDSDEWLLRWMLWGFIAVFFIVLIVPLYMLMSRSFRNA